MKTCLQCNEKMPWAKIIDGKYHNLANRKFCLSCSPFKKRKFKYETSMDMGKLKQKYKEKYKKTKIIRDSRRLLLVLKMGGKCKNCGYDTNIHNLCFHHKNPKTKQFVITSGFLQKKWDILTNEVNKCDLLCIHCHNDLHHPKGLEWKKEIV